MTSTADALKGRDSFPDTKEHGVILLDETVHYRDTEGRNYIVYHDVYLARTDAAQEVMGNRVYTYDREHDSIFLISAATLLPNGTRQELTDRAAFIQSPQREAENGLYTSQQELNLIFPNISAGAVTDCIVVIREDKPVFPDAFATTYTFGNGWPTAKARMVVDFPSAFMTRVKQIESSGKIPAALQTVSGDRVRRVWTKTEIEKIEWEESCPPLSFRAPTLRLTTVDSWDQIAAWFTELLQGRNELGPELEKELAGWTKGLTDRRAIVDAVTGKVANEVRYTGLDFGLAGYQPYPCAQVWSNRYGDCKDKANLLRALLVHKGIPAHLILLNTSHQGQIERRSPSWKQFDHAIVAVEDGAGGYWYCDPTIRYLPAGHLALSDAARDVMIIKSGRAEWRHTPDQLENALRHKAELTLASDGELSGWFTLEAEGADASAYAEYFNKDSVSDLRRSMQQQVEDFFPGAEVMDVDYKPVTGTTDRLKIRAYFLRKAGSATPESIPFAYPLSRLPSVDTNGERSFPFGTSRRIDSFDATISLPKGWNAPQLPTAFHADSNTATVSASWSASPGVLRMALSWAPAAAELPARDYAVFQRSIRSLRTWLAQPAVIARSEAVAAASPERPTDFPLLPTGDGQLRLLNERFPSDERNVERRAAAAQVIQWFPDDATTAFTARIYIALIDGGENNATVASSISEITSRYGANVSTEIRAWADYLQYRCQWWANKDPAALQGLRKLAADRSLTDYRRGWAADYAARFLSETDPAAALALAAEWDSTPNESRDSVLETEAGYLAKIGDQKTTSTWAHRLINSQNPSSDDLLAVTLGELNKQKATYPVSALTQFYDVLTPLLNDPQKFSKSTALLTKIGEFCHAAQTRREFVDAISGWLAAHPQPWITLEKSTEFADQAALEKHLDSSNDAEKGKITVNAALQMIRFYDCDYEKFAKYLFWAAWWLDKDKSDPALLAELAQRAHALPNDEASNIGEVWLKYAASEQKAGRIDQARIEYKTIVGLTSSQPYQRVEASGELGLLEINAGHRDAALAAFDQTLKEYSTHKKGSEYLFAAMMLRLEMGDWDQAESLLNAIAGVKAEYRDAIKYADLLKYLLEDRSKPAQLRAYWKSRQPLRAKRDAFLTQHGVPASARVPLALIDNLAGLQKKLDDNIAAKDSTSFLINLDQFFRTAQFIPIFTMNTCVQGAKIQSIAPAIHRDLLEFQIEMLSDFPDTPGGVQWNARLWQAAILTDLNRKSESATAARELFRADGPDKTVRTAALRIWMLATNGRSDEPNALAAAVKYLSASSDVADRADLVTSVSDAMLRRHDRTANLALLERELNSPEIIAKPEMRKTLTVRMDSLRQDAAAGADFTREVNTWLNARHLNYLMLVPPLSLDLPRYASTGDDGLYGSNNMPLLEAAKCNLLLALDANRPMELRFRAWHKVVTVTGFAERTVPEFTEHYLSAISFKTLPQPIQLEMVDEAAGALVRNAHPAAAEKILNSLEDSSLHDKFAAAYESSLMVARALESYSEKSARAAFEKITEQPVTDFTNKIARQLLTRMVLEGDAGVAAALIESAKDLQPVTGSGLTASSIRLDWNRQLSREKAALPLYQKVRDILATHIAPTKADTKNFQDLTTPYSLDALARKDRGRAIAAAFAGNLFGTVAPFDLISRLSAAASVDPEIRVTGLEIDRAILLDSSVSDQVRASWVAGAAALADADVPQVREQIQLNARNFLAHSETTNTTTMTRRAIRRKLAIVALRTATDDRPADLFGSAAQEDIDPDTIRKFQFMFLASRNRNAEAAELMQQIDADQLASANLFPYVTSVLLATGRTSELAPYQAAATDKLRQDLAEDWIETQPARLLRHACIAQLVTPAQEIPDALFAHSAAKQADAVDREFVNIARAFLHGDMKAQLKAADGVLAKIPDFYEANYFRGAARFALGDLAGARTDLSLFVGKALESEFLPQAHAMLKKL